MVRRALLSVVALALPVSLMMALAPGSASAHGGGTFTGAAQGKVTCTGVTIKVSFLPPATLSTGGDNTSIKGKVTGCSVSGAPVGMTETITQGKILGSSNNAPGSGTGCTGFAVGTTSALNLQITWKGKVNNEKAVFTPTTATVMGAAAASDGSGNAGFEVPNPSTTGSTASGSFAGSAGDESTLFTSQSQNAILTLCNGPKGLKKLNLTHGTVVIP